LLFLHHGRMESPRLPRFKRVPLVGPLHLTERDHNIIRQVHRHRFLRSGQITALVAGSPQQILRRLKLLYHHGYLERPRSQLDYYHHGGSRQFVYGLGNKGGALLKQELGNTFGSVSWGEKNRPVGRFFLEHALLVTDVMVAIELACRKAGIRLVHDHELKLPAKRPSFRWRVTLNSRLKLGIIPDRVFALEYPDPAGTLERAYFLLEADRGTMPVKRRTLAQTSFQRKLLTYAATWSQSIHRTRFGFHRFRVLTVTSSAARVKSLIEACSELDRGHGLFLFADRSILDRPEDLFSRVWQTGRPGEFGSLLN
jgi:hypothetical protein